MTPEFRTAFVKAYSINVASVSDAEVRDFLEDFDKEDNQDKLYAKYPNSYTSIMDAWGVFEAGEKFAKEQLDK